MNIESLHRNMTDIDPLNSQYRVFEKTTPVHGQLIHFADSQKEVSWVFHSNKIRRS